MLHGVYRPHVVLCCLVFLTGILGNFAVSSTARNQDIVFSTIVSRPLLLEVGYKAYNPRCILLVCMRLSVLDNCS